MLFVVPSYSGKGVQLVQKKKTIYPEWNTCFDAHLYEGRMIELAVWKRPETYVSEVSISAQALADKCKEGNHSTIWVGRALLQKYGCGEHPLCMNQWGASIVLCISNMSGEWKMYRNDSDEILHVCVCVCVCVYLY